MKVGLVGFAGSGKTTVFNALTGLNVPVGFGGEVRLGTVKVPDPRIDALSKIFQPKKTTYAEISFADIPGEHAAKKKSLSSTALQQIRDQEVLCLVLRDFTNPALESAPDPLGDLEAFHAECVLADLDIIERKLDRLHKEKANPLEVATFDKMKLALEHERPLRSLSPAELNREGLKGIALLTDRPLMVVLNRGERDAAQPLPEALARRLLEDLGLTESGLARFIRTAYHLMDLISFFTVGPDEVRAWTITRGTKARQAAGRIHSDLERGFIRAEVIPYDVFMQYGSEHAARDAGHLKLEGKDYVVADGEILHVRFNV
jgi:ribosome-binding ATPase YchF (GTP1/OBG family)